MLTYFLGREIDVDLGHLEDEVDLGLTLDLGVRGGQKDEDIGVVHFIVFSFYTEQSNTF